MGVRGTSPVLVPVGSISCRHSGYTGSEVGLSDSGLHLITPASMSKAGAQMVIWGLGL